MREMMRSKYVMTFLLILGIVFSGIIGGDSRAYAFEEGADLNHNQTDAEITPASYDPEDIPPDAVTVSTFADLEAAFANEIEGEFEVYILSDIDYPEGYGPVIIKGKAGEELDISFYAVGGPRTIRTKASRHFIITHPDNQALGFIYFGDVILDGGIVSLDNNSQYSGGIEFLGDFWDLSLSGAEIINCYAAEGGALKYNDNTSNIASLTIVNSAFRNNKAGNNGGALYAGKHISSDGYLHLLEVDFISNAAGKNGGALYFEDDYVDGDSRFLLTGLRFTANTAGENGGAVYAGDKAFGAHNALHIGDTKMLNNQAGKNGGAVYIGDNNGPFAIFGREYSDNQAGGDGGAIYVGKDYMQVSIEYDDGYFEDNSAGGSGGAIYLSDTGYIPEDDYEHYEFYSFYLEDNIQFNRNSAVLDGGAIYIGSVKTPIEISGNISFKKNTAGRNGGAMRIPFYYEEIIDYEPHESWLPGNPYFNGLQFRGNRAGMILEPDDAVKTKVEINMQNWQTDASVNHLLNNYDVYYQQYSVIFMANGGIFDDDTTEQIKIGYEPNSNIDFAKAPVPSREYYRFTSKWYEDEACTVEWMANKVITAEYTILYAGWEINEYFYTIEYYQDDVKMPQTQTAKAKYQTSLDENIVAAQLGSDWLNEYKPIGDYKAGIVKGGYPVIGDDESANIIKVYYEKDSETQNTDDPKQSETDDTRQSDTGDSRQSDTDDSSKGGTKNTTPGGNNSGKNKGNSVRTGDYGWYMAGAVLCLLSGSYILLFTKKKIQK